MMGDAVRSKPWLGLMGNISAIMATLAAFGLAMYCGIEFIGINLAAPFLMIGKLYQLYEFDLGFISIYIFQVLASMTRLSCWQAGDVLRPRCLFMREWPI